MVLSHTVGNVWGKSALLTLPSKGNCPGLSPCSVGGHVEYHMTHAPFIHPSHNLLDERWSPDPEHPISKNETGPGIGHPP